MTKSKTPADVPDESEVSTKGKSKLLVLLFVAAVLAAAGGWFFFVGGSAEAEEPHPGAVLTLEPVTVNLAGGGYLKVGVALQLTEDASAEEEPDGSKALDLIISHFSGTQPTDIAGARAAFQESLEQQIVEAYEGLVMEIYYTDYVTQ